MSTTSSPKPMETRGWLRLGQAAGTGQREHDAGNQGKQADRPKSSSTKQYRAPTSLWARWEGSGKALPMADLIIGENGHGKDQRNDGGEGGDKGQIENPQYRQQKISAKNSTYIRRVFRMTRKSFQMSPLMAAPPFP